MVLAIGFNILHQIQSKILFVIAMFKPNQAKKTLIDIWYLYVSYVAYVYM
jgi:hypothetical protein